MSNITLQDAESDLSKVIDRAERGEAVTITRNGTPVAAVVPIEAADMTCTAPQKRKPSLVELLMAFPGGDEVFERNPSPSRDVDL